MAPDGSPVEVFAALPVGPAAQYVAAAVRPGGTILDLGAGAGRLAAALTGLGYSLTAVDESAAMLARMAAGIRTVHCPIQELALGERFDGVVLSSYLVNHPDLGSAFLAVGTRHLADGGALVVQRYDPAWVAEGSADEAEVGGVTIGVSGMRRSGARFDAVVTYRMGGRSWDQRVSAAVVDDGALADLAAGAGLRIAGWLDEFRTWAVLRRYA